MAGFINLGVITVTNIGNEIAGLNSPVTFTIANLPATITFLDASPVLNDDASVGDRGWSCSGNTCTLVERSESGVKNAALAAGGGARADVRFQISQDAVIVEPPADLLEKSTEMSKKGDIAGVKELFADFPHFVANANVAGDIDPANDEAVLNFFGPKTEGGSVGEAGEGDAIVAGVYVDSKIRGPVYPGSPFKMELRLLATGSATQSGDFSFSDVMPKALGVTNVKVSGEGWSCDNNTSPNKCTHSGPDLTPGVFSSPLIIEGRVAKTAAVTEQPLSWVINSVSKATIDNSPIESNAQVSVRIVPMPEPDVAIRLVPRDGKSSISAPGSVTVDALVRSVYGAGENVTITVSMRKGLTFQGLVDPVEGDKVAGWTCSSASADQAAGDGATAQKCVKELMESETPETIGFEISASEDTEAGSAQVIAEISADNEADKYKAGNRVAHNILVQPLPAAMPGIVLTRPNEKGVTVAVTDGSATELTIGKTSTYALAVQNLGAKPMEAGTVLRLEQYVDATAVFSGPSAPKSSNYKSALDGQAISGNSGKWVCAAGTATQPAVDAPAGVAPVVAAVQGATVQAETTATTAAPKAAAPKSGPAIRCEITLSSAVAAGADTPVLNLTVKPANNAKVGKPEWPVFASIPAKKDAPVARFGMTVSIVEFSPDLVPAFIAPAGPRPGGEAVATLSVRNGGNADASAQFLIVPGITSGRVTKVEGESWKCARIGSALAAGFTVCSRTAALKVGAETPSVSVAYDSTDTQAKTITLQAVSIVTTPRGTTTTRVSKLPVELRPALSFSVKGPETVVDQLVDAKGNRVANTILLTTEGNGSGAEFTWKQMCTTDAEVKASGGECTSVAPKVKWASGEEPNGPTASAIAPIVEADTTLLFEVTAREGGSSSSARASVRVLPIVTVEGPTGKATSGSGSSVLRRVPKQGVSSTRSFAATAPTTGTGDASYTTSSDVSVTVNPNVFGASTTVAQGASISLTAAAAGSGAVSYAWSQAAGPATSVLTGSTTNAATVTFTAPASNVTLSLRVVATDARGQVGSSIVNVVVGSGGTPAVATTITEGDGPIVVDTAKSFTLNATASGTGAITYAWTQVSGAALTLNNANTSAVTVAATAATGTATLLVTATDAAGASASDLVTLQLAPSGAPTPLCDFVEAVTTKTTSKLTATLSAIGLGNIDLTQFAVNADTCNENSKVSFTNAGFSLAGYLTVSGATGSVSAAGLTIRSARFTGPADWGSPQFAIASNDPVGLFIPFSRASVSIGAFEGEIVSGAMPFLALPGGWVPSATLTFSVDAAGDKFVSLDATATGPAKNGVTPTGRVFGAVATNGTYALEASLNNALDLFGSTVSFTGSVRKTDPAGKAAVNLAGSLQGPLTITKNVVLSSLTAAYNETGVVSGSGSMLIGEGDAALAVSADLSYTDGNNHSLAVKAVTANGKWTPAKDVTIPLASASGSYTVTAGAKAMNIEVVGGNVTPFSGLQLVAPTMTAKATCAANAASCDIVIDLSSDAAITLGSTSTTGKLAGTYDVTKKTASFEASIGRIPVVAGLELTSASLKVASTNVGTATMASTVTLAGSMTAFEKTVTASATFSKDGVLLTADLPEIAPFGASGPSFKPGQLSWASGPLTITPKVPSLPNLKSVTLTPKVPRLNAAIALPKEMTEFATQTLQGVSDLALDGDVDFSTGKFSLAAALATDVVDASGSIGRDSSAGGYKYSLAGKVKKPISLTNTVKINSLDFTFGNTTAGGPAKFAGTGAVDVTLPDSTVLAVAGSLTYNSATDYSLAVSVGATSPSFAVNGGETLNLGKASGSFVRNAQGSTMTVDLSSDATWKPVSGLSVSAVSAKAALTCATGATSCAVTFNVKGTLGFDLGISGLNSANVEGNLDANGFTFTAKFNDLAFATDIKLLAPTFALKIPPKTSAEKASATLSGTFSLFDTNVSGSMTFSSAGVLLVGDFPSFKFPNSDIGFDGGQFAWALKAPSSIAWTPTVPKLTLPSTNLLQNAPKIALSMPMPDAVKQLSADGGATLGGVTIQGSMNLQSGAFDMSASFTSTQVDVSGSVARAGTGKPLTYSLAAKVKSPVTVVDGVKIASLDMALSNATGTVVVNGSGQIVITTTNSDITIGFALDYKSSTDYSFNASVVPSNTASWTPFPGFTIPLGGLSGSMSRKGDTKTFALAFKGTSDWVPFPGLKVAEPGAGINATCKVGAACVLAFTASGKVSVDVGSGWQGPAVVAGSFTKDASTITATFPNINVTTGVSILSPALTLGYTKTGGISASVSGASDILGTRITMGVTFSAQGVVVAGGLNDWKPLGDAGPTLSNASFAFSTYAVSNFTLPSAPALGQISLAAGKPSLLAGFGVPSWLRDLVKDPNLKVVPVTIPLSDLAGGKLPTLRIMIPTPSNWFIYNIGGSSMRITGLGFEIAGTPTPSLSVIGTTEMRTGSSGETPVPFEMRGTVTTTSVSIALSLGRDASGTPFAWNNAFGISGLTLTDAAIQVGINFATTPIPLPTLGIAATAQLPSAWRSAMNMDAGVAVRLAANIDVTKPCFQFQAGTLQSDNKTISKGTAKVVSIGGGVLTSTFMDLTIAPTGCQIGNVVIDPGISAGFSGTVLGTPVDVRAKIGASPFTLEASLAIGAFNAGPVKLDETRLGVKISPTDNFVSFAGGITIGSTKVSVDGKAGINTTDGPYLDMVGSIDNLVIVPSFIEVRTARVNMSIKPAKGTASIIANGDFTMLGSPSKVDLNVQMANYEVQSVKASLVTRRTVASVFTVDGAFSIDWAKGSAPNIAFDATGSVAGYNLGRVTGFINGNQVNVTGTVNVGGVFSAQVNGQVVWQAASGVNIINRAGQSVAAASGDFRIAATNISLNLGGFGATGSVVIGRAQNLVYGDFNASFVIGAGDVGGTVNVAGSFASDGNFSFNGSGTLNLIGFNAAVSVSGSKSGANWAFAMNSTFSVMGAVNVAFGGNFYKSGTTTRFTMTGSADLRAAGIGGGRGDFRISNEPGQAGLFASVSVNISGVSGSGALWVGADGTFDTTLNVSVNFPGVNVGGNLKIGNVAWSNGVRYRGGTYFQIDAWFSLAGVWFRMYGNVNADGSFRFTAQAGPWWWDTGFCVVVICLRFGASFSSSLTITSWAPYIAVAGSGYAYVDGQTWSCWWSGGWRPKLRCGWGSWGRWASAGIGFNTNPGNMWISLWGYRFNLR